MVLTIAGITKKQHSRLSLTKKGKLLLQKEDYSEIFILFLKTYTLIFFWAYNDRFPNQAIGQLAFLYSLYLLNKYGDVEWDVNFYCALYFKAFPKLLEIEDNRFLKRIFFWSYLWKQILQKVCTMVWINWIERNKRK